MTIPLVSYLCSGVEASETVFFPLVTDASTPEHKHDITQDKGSGVEVFCSVLMLGDVSWCIFMISMFFFQQAIDFSGPQF